jgi:hypothetical protein
MRQVVPLLGIATEGFAYQGADDETNHASLTPTVGTWDWTTVPLALPVNVPQGERWLCQVNLQSFIAGPNVPSYQCAFAIVLTGATVFQPPSVTQTTPWSYHLGIATAGDAAWGFVSAPMWFNAGQTIVNFAHGRDAGAVTLAHRKMSVLPMMSMRA